MAAPRLSRTRPQRGRTVRRPARGRSAVGRRGRAGRTGRAVRGARGSLRGFRQASIVAIALTGLIFLFLGLDEEDAMGAPTEGSAVVAAAAPRTAASGTAGTETRAGQATGSVAPQEAAPPDTVPEGEFVAEPGEVVGEVIGELRATARSLRDAFLGNLPRYIVAFLVLLLAWLLTRILRPLLRRVLGQWERAQAITALTGVMIWLFALGIAISVLVGDVRALVGSLGLIGLALSWALQNPIESFTGWLMNGMRGYYRVGDRIAVGEVLGDVFRIDFFTTTVWEIGGPDRQGVFVTGEQPTGRLITFPNNEVLTGSIVNFTRDFPFVWDELSVPVASESDLGFAMDVLRGVAEEVVGGGMAGPAEAYERILRARRLESSIPRGPQVFLSLSDSGADLTVRYLVNARERRIWKTRLTQAVMEAFALPEHRGRILPGDPRIQIMSIGPDGRPRESPVQREGTSVPQDDDPARPGGS